jgi:3-oxoacyl-[acyl-carrier protein] reductase
MRWIDVSPEPQTGQISRLCPEVDLRGKRVLAFGGGGSLGAVFAEQAAAAGAEVIVAEQVPHEQAEGAARAAGLSRIAGRAAAAGAPVLPRFLTCDVTEPQDVAAAVAAARQGAEPLSTAGAPGRAGGQAGAGGAEDWNQDAAEAVDSRQAGGGRLDIVIDFAGLHHAPFHFTGRKLEEEVRTFRQVIDVNLTGAFIVTAAAARAMLAQGHGHIIHLCSNGSRAALYGSYAYTASKHGVEGLVKTAAAQLAPYGVRVNGIAPGTVETPLNSSLLRDDDGTLRPRAKSILAHTPTKRFATPQGVAETLLAMCIDQRHFTGNVVFADDGYNIEGHSWPEGNEALYAERLEALLEQIREQKPE